MYIPYNPFEPVDLPLLQEMLSMKKYFLVIQGFSWPGVVSGTGFMVSPYKEEELAKQHSEKLEPNKVRFYDLQSEFEKVKSLINDPRYLFFVNNLSDDDWADKMLQHYMKNVISFLKENNFGRKGIDIELAFEYGKLKAIIQSNISPKKEFDAYEVFSKS